MPSPPNNAEAPQPASIPSFVSRAGFFWRGGAVTLAVVFGASLVVAFAVGDVYESESIVEFAEPAASPPGPRAEPAPADQLRRVLFEPPVLEQMRRELASGAPAAEGSDASAGPTALEETRSAIEIKPKGDRQFAIAFRAPSAAAAHKGADWLATAAVRGIEASPEPIGEEGSKKIKALEERTRELAAFVAEHPEVALNPSTSTTSPRASASGSTPTPPPADSALLVLQQQRATLEWRLADAEKKEATGPANPYDAPTDKAGLQRMLAQVRAAIAARQAVALRSGADAKADPSAARPPPATPAAAALQSEWQRLVEAVVQAQLQAPKRDAAAQTGALRVVQRAALPIRPLKPDRRLIGLLGLAVGVWLGILWAFVRVALGHDLRLGWREMAEEGEGDETGEQPARANVPLGWGPAAAAYDAAIVPAPELMSGAEPPTTARDGGAAWQFRSVGNPNASPLRQGPAARIPKQLLTTAPGVGEASRMPQQIGGIPNRSPEVQKPIVEMNPTPEPIRTPLPPAGSVPPGGMGAGMGGATAGNSSSGAGQRHMRATGTTQTFASPIPGVHYEVSGSVRPAAGTPSTQPPGATLPQYPLALRQRPPQDAFSLRDVPLGWSPNPAMLQTGSLNELLTLRDQLYRLAANGCFVVGVTSDAEAVTDKSCVAAQLASVLAGPARARVLLIEANFDRPSVHSMMRIDMPFSQGFSEQMRKRMTGGARTPWVLFRCAPQLHVLAEGLVRTPGLLSSVQFGEALSELRAHYDIIVADGPIAANTVDTVAFDALMDGIVVVGAVGSAPAKLLENASRWFKRKQLMAVISADASAEQRIEFGSQTT